MRMTVPSHHENVPDHLRAFVVLVPAADKLLQEGGALRIHYLRRHVPQVGAQCILHPVVQPLAILV